MSAVGNIPTPSRIWAAIAMAGIPYFLGFGQRHVIVTAARAREKRLLKKEDKKFWRKVKRWNRLYGERLVQEGPDSCPASGCVIHVNSRRPSKRTVGTFSVCPRSRRPWTPARTRLICTSGRLAGSTGKTGVGSTVVLTEDPHGAASACAIEGRRLGTCLRRTFYDPPFLGLLLHEDRA